MVGGSPPNVDPRSLVQFCSVPLLGMRFKVFILIPAIGIRFGRHPRRRHGSRNQRVRHLDCSRRRVELPPDRLYVQHRRTIRHRVGSCRARAQGLAPISPLKFIALKTYRQVAASHQYRGYARTGPRK